MVFTQFWDFFSLFSKSKLDSPAKFWDVVGGSTLDPIPSCPSPSFEFISPFSSFPARREQIIFYVFYDFLGQARKTPGAISLIAYLRFLPRIMLTETFLHALFFVHNHFPPHL